MAYSGSILKDNGKFGFIKQDSGEADMFILTDIGGVLPPVGTRVLYDVVADRKTGKPRAENVIVEGARYGASGTMMDRFGTLITVADHGKFGFIRQDSGEADMFALTPIGGALPPVGTRVMYNCVIDNKTGKPRTEDIEPLEGPDPNAAMAAAPMRAAPAMPVFQQNPHQMAFQQPVYQQPMFQPMQQPVYQAPAPVPHGRPFRQDMGGAQRAAPQSFHQRTAQHAQAPSGKRAGTMMKDNGKFGFIQQDSGEEDMFVLAPLGGGALPTVGTRILYDVITDPKTGRLRAENVVPEMGGYAPEAPAPQMSFAAPAQQAGASFGKLTGTILKDNGKFGFIQQDSGEGDMFVLAPLGGGALPPVGTRVAYDVIQDPKTGRPRAENIEEESGGFGAAAAGGLMGSGHRAQPY